MTDREREIRERDLPRGDQSEDAEPMLPRRDGEDVVAWVERNIAESTGWVAPPERPKTYQEQLEERLKRLRQQPPEREPGQEG